MSVFSETIQVKRCDYNECKEKGEMCIVCKSDFCEVHRLILGIYLNDSGITKTICLQCSSNLIDYLAKFEMPTESLVIEFNKALSYIKREGVVKT